MDDVRRDPAEFFTSTDDLEAALEVQVQQPANSEALLLVINDNSDGCGPEVVDDVVGTTTGLNLIQAVDETDQACVDALFPGSMIFAVETSLLPDHDGQVMIDNDWMAFLGPVTIDVPG